MQQLYERIFYSKKVAELYTAEAMINYLLRFESALATAQAKQSIVPDTVAAVIDQCCRVEYINKEQLINEAALGGNVAIPLVKQLTAVVAKKDAEAAKYIHFGATSQDVIDTALMLQTRDAFRLILEELRQLNKQLVSLIEEHRETVMVGRTFLQQARPITFGFKVAGWLAPLLRSQKEIDRLLKEGFVLQLGGAVGTLASMPEKGLQVSVAMSQILQLTNPEKSWHTERDGVVRVATTLGVLTGNIGKIAKDISLLMQTEVAEVLEPSIEGKGVSSAMPHKRNPVGCITILANAARVPGLVSTMLSCMTQDQERATGLWHAEWETLASIVQLTAGCVNKVVEITSGLEVRKEQMLHNLELTKGLIYAENVSFALAEKLGKAKAHEVVEQYSKEANSKKLHLKELLLSKEEITGHLNVFQVEELFDPTRSVGLCRVFIKNVLAAVDN
ncbi:MAG TPA: 3-carboxy-cis,cis-muconate cycloisomerase [Flavisolibacter sp.]|nr:3-carboxy-cis,cis-muconate cycloisomerase [Flavisolibacter sp.]